MFDHNFSENNKTLLVLLLVILIFFITSLFIFTVVKIGNVVKEGQYIGAETKINRTIAVSGKGEVYAKPDIALVTFSVTTEDKTVARAMKINSNKMNAVLDAIKKQGVKSEDLKTTNFAIAPRYEWRKNTKLYPSGTRVLVGYDVSQSLQVKIRDMQKIGDIIQLATNAGANQVGNLYFTFNNPQQLKDQARGEAIKEARIKAKELSSQLGVGLVRIMNFSENKESIPRYYGLERAVAMPGGGETPQIETGQNKIESNVTITYEIR